jgi:hypothetical protein
MTAKNQTTGLLVMGGVALSMVILAGVALLGADDPIRQRRPAAAAPEATPPAPAPVPAAAVEAKVPAALVKAPTQLALAAYELTPGTFLAWKNYLAGDAKSRFWERIAWRTNLWDAVVDAHTQDRPILLEVHGGNALGRC